MTQAKYYIYRNLRTKGFSVKYRGLVIDRLDSFVGEDVQFKVNELGRQRVIFEGRKNVHAYAVCDKYYSAQSNVDNLDVITYNPYTAGHFTCNGAEIETVKKVAFYKGKCYLESK